MNKCQLIVTDHCFSSNEQVKIGLLREFGENPRRSPTADILGSATCPALCLEAYFGVEVGGNVGKMVLMLKTQFAVSCIIRYCQKWSSMISPWKILIAIMAMSLTTKTEETQFTESP